MATTTNYGWVTPDDTALVKDGAAAIRTLGTSADTTVYNNDLAAIKKAIVDAKGDIIAATAADTVARLAVGATNGMLLTVDSSTATGLKYALPAGGGSNFTLLNSGGTALTGAQTITVSGISGADKIFVRVVNGRVTGSNDDISFRINTDSGSNYFPAGNEAIAAQTYNAGNFRGFSDTSTNIRFCNSGESSSNTFTGSALISGCNASGVKVFQVTGGANGGIANNTSYSHQGIWQNSATVTSISVFAVSNNFNLGTVFVYTSA